MPWAHVWTQVADKPAPPVRPIEVAAAVVLILLALALRWTRPRTASGGAPPQTALASAKWPSSIRRPTFRQALVAVFTGCAVGLFIGGSDGVPIGMVASIGVLVFGSRRESDSERRARLRLIAAAPPVVDLFAAGLSAGLLPADAAAIAANAFVGPLDSAQPTSEIAERFAAAAQSLRRGVDPEAAWRALAVDSATAPVAAAAVRASRTGAPASETVAKAARDLWRAAEHVAQTQVRSLAVRVTVPLALCFLPAFVLVGIAPTALGILAELRP